MKTFSLICFTAVLFYPAILSAHGAHPHASIQEVSNHMEENAGLESHKENKSDSKNTRRGENHAARTFQPLLKDAMVR